MAGPLPVTSTGLVPLVSVGQSPILTDVQMSVCWQRHVDGCKNSHKSVISVDIVKTAWCWYKPDDSYKDIIRVENSVLLVWLAWQGIAAVKTQRGLCMQPAAILRTVWRPAQTCC